MKPTRTVALEFQPTLDGATPGEELRDGLSAVLQVANTLWLANDESASVERLTLQGTKATAHRQFALRDCLELPEPGDDEDTPEVDVEGLDFADGYLWLTGSHSLKRCKPETDDTPRKALQRLADIDADANRFLLARIPLVTEDGVPALARKAKDSSGKRRAQALPADRRSNTLTRLLRKDPHLGPFMRLPGKDNGFDVEGLAVAGERVFLGLRGPVLRGWASVLELRPQGGAGSTLELARFAGRKSDRRLRKHFLQLDGLGVRDLCLDGDDLLLLAGPTMGLDGPVRVLRWVGAAACEDSCLVERDQLRAVLEVPCGTGCDHAEGMTLFRSGARARPALLVVHDQPAAKRKPGASAVLADVFELPRA